MLVDNRHTPQLRNKNHYFNYYRLRNWFYYSIKPFLPRYIQIAIRRQIAKYKKPFVGHIWPIDPSSRKAPSWWTGWPQNKRFGFFLSHDVDTRQGYDRVIKLANIDRNLGFCSTFNFVPEKYGEISIKLLDELRRRGFGVGIHGLNHDGKLFLSKNCFNRRASKINDYLYKWTCRGFSSPSMHHNLEWLEELNIDWSISTFDTDPFEPQPDSAATIFPIWIQHKYGGTGHVELPYTMPQDSTLFIILREKNINLWKKKLDWIAENGGMALVNTHPDYMAIDAVRVDSMHYPISFYTDLLDYVRTKYRGSYYHKQTSTLAGIINNMIELHDATEKLDEQ